MAERALERKIGAGCTPGEDRRRTILRAGVCFTVLFLILVFLMLLPFFREGRSLVYNDDGLKQHVKALDFYGRWLRSLPGRFASGGFSLPTWSMALGYGSDVVTTLHYYVIGDPLNLLAVFFDTGSIVYLFNALIVIRLFLSGLSFLAFAGYVTACTDSEAYRKEGGRVPALAAGALLYTFSAFAVFTAARHPFFVNPMIWFPLVLLGVEKIFREKRFLLFTLAVMMSALSNFYFFYMIVILTVLYVVWRILALYGIRKLRNAFAPLFMILWSSILGVMLSCILFLPVTLQFLANPRLDTGYAVPLLYDTLYYKKMAAAALTGYGAGDWTFLGYTGFGAMAVILLLRKGKSYRRLLSLFFISAAMLLFPAVGSLMNGSAYVANRWTWAVSLLMGMFLAAAWKEFSQIDTHSMVETKLQKSFCSKSQSIAICTELT